MKLYEIEKADIRNYGNYKKAILAMAYILRDDTFIRSAFNFGSGTKKDMNNYMRNNAAFCLWVDAETMEVVKSV